MTERSEQRKFQAETKQILQLLIHSVYSNPDTFLRELVSNASDALDKLRLESIQNSTLDADTSDLHIDIVVDKEARTLTVRDNGIGMSWDEVIDLIGTMAKSGTDQLRKALEESKNSAVSSDLIGQFGIGFYSTFMVADTVSLVTQKVGESTSTRWESDGEDSYSIEAVEGGIQGTSITLKLKPSDSETHLPDYTQESTIRGIIKKYSDFISWPIRMDVESTVDGTTEITSETLNSMKALWLRPEKDVTKEEYTEFYRHVSGSWDEPLDTIHINAEGVFEYRALLFIPSRAPFDLFQQDARRGVQLYVKRVFVMENFEDLIPSYLRFVKGVVDAEDLSLNVSREILQKNRQIATMRRHIVRKVLAAIKKMKAERYADYQILWRQFGAVLKEGLLSDNDNQETLLEVLSFTSSKTIDGASATDTKKEAHPDSKDQADDDSSSGEAAQNENESDKEAADNPQDSESLEDSHLSEWTTLGEYVGRMKRGQEEIYYLTGSKQETIKDSPYLEAFDKKDVEVLILTDPVDEVWVTVVPEFQGKKLRSIATGDVNLEGIHAEGESDDDSATKSPEGQSVKEEEETQFSELLAWMSEILSDSVKGVRLSSRLVSSVAVLVGDEFEMSPMLQQLYRSSGQSIPEVKRTLEINPSHPLIVRLKNAIADPEAKKNANLAIDAKLVEDMAVLAEGGSLDDPSRFVRLVADRLANGGE